MNDPKARRASTFWEHLEELRKSIGKILVGILAVAVIAFVFKEQLFSILLAPKSDQFITYRWMRSLSACFPSFGGEMDSFSVALISTELTQQFVTHIKMAMYAGFLLVFPYILYELFCFVSPALYAHERKYAFRVVSSGYLMFMLGVALSYFLIFPLTFRFLGTYQVSPDVENQILLSSYIGTLMMLNLLMGIVFEIPILCWLFAKLGFLTASFMRQYRRHAIVILLVIAALITPTADVVTLLLVSFPMYFLYEMSIVIVALTKKNQQKA